MPSSPLSIEDLKELAGKLSPKARPVEIKPDTDLFNANVLDSLSIVQYVTLIEKRYSITFNYNDIRFENFRTLEHLQALLRDSYRL